MSSWWWYLSRASGIVATAVAGTALISGLFFSARNTGERRSPAWWLDLHNYLGGLALGLTGVHVLMAVLDPHSGVGLVQALIPGTAPALGWALNWGVLAAYLMAAAVFTTWPRRRLQRGLWRVVHLGSVAAVAFAGLHAYAMGSETSEALFRLALLAAAAAAVYAVALRALAAGRVRAGR